MKKLLLIAISAFISAYASGRSEFWSNASESTFATKGMRSWMPQSYRALRITSADLKEALGAAPLETQVSARQSNAFILLPRPEGDAVRFRIVESPVMDPVLSQAYPQIRTFLAEAVENPAVSARLDITEHGFHAMVFSEDGVYFIEPYHFGNTEEYLAYYKKDIRSILPTMVCEMDGSSDNNDQAPILPQDYSAQRSIGSQLRTYRLALACTGEYAQFFGGTKSAALSAMVTSLNRCNGIFERELDIRLVLVPNDTLLIYLNPASDPYSNTNSSALLSENQINVNSVIGSSNYDIGHVFSTGGGGVAFRGSVCSSSSKARGVTGSSFPVGDPYDVDYVAHEMGHQFGANHTFNATSGACSGNRVGSAAYEPGSASTIMGYAGICNTNDLQSNSDAYFHTYSMDEITSYMVSGAGNSCATVSSTGNSAPVVSFSGDYVIPYQTPFRLTASASDPNGDPITYCWEQMDNGPSGNWNTPSGDAPIFRSFQPQSSPTRFFPNYASVIGNTTQVGEIKPSYARTLHFRCSVRDNRAGGGGIAYNDTLVSVQAVNTGSGFAVTYPNASGISWLTGTQQTITWNVAQSDLAPINTPFVNIYLSTNNGNTYPVTLGTNIPNTGSYTFTVPMQLTSTARVWIEGAGNVFYDISNNSFSILLNTATQTLDPDDAVSVYPNPGNGAFELHMPDVMGREFRAEVFNSLGCTLMSRPVQVRAGIAHLDLTGYPAGVYFLRLTGPSVSLTKRLVVVN